ncbi:MAG: sirohydrochlorin nickelochelatase [Methanocorpusculum parvum]|nr:sirohydrochlorin nickelochelatase [Methanocorpusculum parvum]
MTKCGLLLIGHGSRTGESADVLKKTADFLQELSGCTVWHAFLEFSSPSVPEVLSEIKETDAEEIIAVPMLLARGTHTEKTIPALLGFLDGEKEGVLLFADGRSVPVRCAEPIGADMRLAEILLERAFSTA